MKKTRELQALEDSCRQEGCPLCRVNQETVDRYLDSWKYELFTDVGVRQELRRTQGFCHTHTWQLVRMGATLPLAQAYRDILSDALEHLQQGQSDLPAFTSSGNLLRRLFEPRAEQTNSGAICPACRQRENAEERYIYALRQALLDDVFYRTLADSSGLCLNHFRLANTIKTPDVPGDWPALLRQAQIATLQRLDAQLGELIRKHDYRFKDEPRGPEMLSWKRAAGLVAGEEF